MADAHIEGLDGVLAKMRNFAPTLQKKVLRKVIRKGANIIKKAAVDNAKRLDDPSTEE